MKITDVETFYLSLPTIEDRTDSSQDALLIRIATDAGIFGIGEVDSCPSVVRAIIESPKSHTQVHGLRELLVGQDPLEIARLWERMYQGTLYYGRSGVVIQAMAGVDLALWDIKGKVLGIPVYRLLGGAFHESLPAYASLMFGWGVEETTERAKMVQAQGYRAMKFGWEPFGRDPALDVALTHGIRDAVGYDVDLMLDAGLAWDARTAIERIHLLEPFKPFWVEEPVPPDDLAGYRKISEHVSTRIAGGEEEATLEGFIRLMDEGQVDVVQVDVTRVGLTQAMKVADHARRRGISVCNHSFTTGVNAAASIHFLTAIPGALYLEYCMEPGDLARRLVRNPLEVTDGRVRPLEEPGLGVDIDWDVAEKYLVRG